MSLLPFDQIVAKLDRWNAQRLATIMEKSGDDEQKVFENSIANKRPFEQSIISDEDEKGQKDKNQNLQKGEQEINRKNICKPMASSTPIVLSPTSVNSRRQKVFSVGDGHSEVSSISKCSSAKFNLNFGHFHVSLRFMNFRI